MLKKLAAIGLATSIGFAPIIITPMVAMAATPPTPAAPAVDAPAPADTPAPTKKHKKHKKAVDAAATQPRASAATK